MFKEIGIFLWPVSLLSMFIKQESAPRGIRDARNGFYEGFKVLNKILNIQKTDKLNIYSNNVYLFLLSKKVHIYMNMSKSIIMRSY